MKNKKNPQIFLSLASDAKDVRINVCRKTIKLFSEVARQEAIGTNFEIQEIQFRNKKKLLYHECSNIGTGRLISILGDIQNSLGQGPEQGLDSMISRCPCQPPQLFGSVSRTFPSLGHRTVCSQSVSGCYSRCFTSSIRSFPQPLPFVISHLEFTCWQCLLPKESTQRGGRLYIIFNTDTVRPQCRDFMLPSSFKAGRKLGVATSIFYKPGEPQGGLSL